MLLQTNLYRSVRRLAIVYMHNVKRRHIEKIVAIHMFHLQYQMTGIHTSLHTVIVDYFIRSPVQLTYRVRHYECII